VVLEHCVISNLYMKLTSFIHEEENRDYKSREETLESLDKTKEHRKEERKMS
jgi:hypothetical protein